MSGTPEGGFRRAATVAGLTEAEYRRRIASGLKRCTRCKDWHPRSAFGADSSRPDGLAAACLASREAHYRAANPPRPRPPHPMKDKRFKNVRPGDKQQARHRVNHLRQTGRLPSPDDLACVDCGHVGGAPRHEYDHYLGYDAQHHEHVQAVCSTCHHKRTRARGEANDFGRKGRR